MTVHEENSIHNGKVGRHLDSGIAVGMTVVFIAAITIAALSFGISVPGATARANPATLNEPGSPLPTQGIRELAPGNYEVYMVAQTWNFVPDRLEVPQGSK